MKVKEQQKKILIISCIVVTLILISIGAMFIKITSVTKEKGIGYRANSLTTIVNGISWSYDKVENLENPGEFFAENVRLSESNYDTWFDEGEIIELPEEIVVPDTLDGYIVKTIGINNNSFYYSKVLEFMQSEMYENRSVYPIEEMATDNGETCYNEALFDLSTYVDGQPLVLVDNRVFVNNSDAYSLDYYKKFMTAANFASIVSNFDGGPVEAIKKITIPDTVTSIAPFAFYCFSELEEVIIPENLTDIGDFAFGSCTSLTTVKTASADENATGLILPSSVRKVGNGAFSNTSSLEVAQLNEGLECVANNLFNGSKIATINIPDSVISIGNNAFERCSDLLTLSISIENSNLISIGTRAFLKTRITTFNLPNSLEIIENEAFKESSLNTIVIDETESNLLEIGKSVFASSKITSVTLPSSITTLGTEIFANCQELVSATINCNTGIAEDMFNNCIKLNDINFSNEITSIAARAFCGCRALTTIALPTSLEIIGDNAFELTGLISIVIPDTVTTMGIEVFKKCQSLLSVTFSSGIDNIPEKTFFECSVLNNVVIPDNVLTINEYAFYRCTGLSSIDLGEGVTNLASYAFSECTALVSVEIPGTVEIINNYLFERCSLLSNVILNEGVTTINKEAFYKCDSITAINIPASITKIAEYAFINLANLNTLTVTDGSSSYSSVDNILYNADKTQLICCPRGKSGVVTIEETTTEIGERAFYLCKSVSGNLNITNNVKIIEKEAFYGATGFNGTLILGDEVTTIGDEAFYGCSNLTGEISISSKVSEIGNKAFYNCTGFNGGLLLGESVQSIGEKAFSSLNIAGALVIPDSTISIGSFAFNACQGITSLTLGDGLAKIGSGAFYMCRNINGTVETKTGLKSIDAYAFFGCSGIDTLIISDTVTHVAIEALKNCTDLKDIYVDKLENEIIISDKELYAEKSYIHYSDCKHTVTIGQMPEGVRIVDELDNDITTAEYECGETLSYKIIGDSIVTISQKLTKQGEFVDYGDSIEFSSLQKDTIYTINSINRNMAIDIAVENLGTLTVHYKDLAGNSIADDEVFTGIQGEHFVINRKDIDGYLSADNNVLVYSGDFEEGNLEYTFVYGKKSANVIVRHLDKYGNELVDATVLYGIVGNAYSSERKEITGFVSSEENPENMTGVYSEEESEVIFKYESTIKGLYTSNSNKKIIVTVENEPLKEQVYNLNIVKIDSETDTNSVNYEKTLSGAKFSVIETLESGNVTLVDESNPTDVDGIISVINQETVIEGTPREFVITEISSADGYELLPAPIVLTISVNAAGEFNLDVVPKYSTSLEIVNEEIVYTPEQQALKAEIERLVQPVITTNGLGEKVVTLNIKNDRKMLEHDYSISIDKVGVKGENEVSLSGVGFSVEEINYNTTTGEYTLVENGLSRNNLQTVNGKVEIVDSTKVIEATQEERYYRVVEENTIDGYVIKVKEFIIKVSIDLDLVTNTSEINSEIVAIKYLGQNTFVTEIIGITDVSTYVDESDLVVVKVENRALTEKEVSLNIKKQDDNTTPKKLAGTTFNVVEVIEGQEDVLVIENSTNAEGILNVLTETTVIEGTERIFKITEKVPTSGYIAIGRPVLLKISTNVDGVLSYSVEVDMELEPEVSLTSEEVALKAAIEAAIEINLEDNVLTLTIENTRKMLEQEYSMQVEKVTQSNEYLAGATFSVVEVDENYENIQEGYSLNNVITGDGENETLLGIAELIEQQKVIESVSPIRRFKVTENATIDRYSIIVKEMIVAVSIDVDSETNTSEIKVEIEAVKYRGETEFVDYDSLTMINDVSVQVKTGNVISLKVANLYSYLNKIATYDLGIEKVDAISGEKINNTEFSIEEVSNSQMAYETIANTRVEGLFTGDVNSGFAEGKATLLEEQRVGEDAQDYKLERFYRIIEENPAEGYLIGINEFIVKVNLGQENSQYKDDLINAQIVKVKYQNSEEYVDYNATLMPELAISIDENNLIEFTLKNARAPKTADYKMDILKIREGTTTGLTDTRFRVDEIIDSEIVPIANTLTYTDGYIHVITNAIVTEGTPRIYKIVENEAPTDYKGIEKPFLVTVDVNSEGKLTAGVAILDENNELTQEEIQKIRNLIDVTIDENNLITITVENERILKKVDYSLEIQKFVTDTTTVIEGAEFTIEELDNENNVINTYDNIITIEGGLGTVINSENLETVVEETPRRYRIIENSTPTQYVELTSPIIATLSVNSSTGALEILVEAENNDETGVIALDKISYTIDSNNNIIFKIENDMEETGFSLNLAKVDKDNITKLIGGADFEVKKLSEGSNTEGETAQSLETVENEMLLVGNSEEVIAGDIYRYSIREIRTPEGYRRFIYEIIVAIEVNEELEIVPTIEAIRFNEDDEFIDVTDLDNNPITDMIYKNIFENYIRISNQENNPNNVVLLIANEKVDFDLNMKMSVVQIDTTELTNKIPEARVENNIISYQENTELEYVQKGNMVTYLLRAFNEGNIPGIVDEMMIEIPEGLKFLPENEINNGWIMYKNVSGEFVETTDVTQATHIKTTNFTKNGEAHNSLVALGETVDYAETKVAFEVIAENSSNIQIENFATVSSSTDKLTNNNTDSAVIKLKNFNLSIKKFITTVTTGSIEKTYEREPVVSVTAEGAVEYSTVAKATPVYVDTASEITYTMRVYNEDTISGTAKEIVESIPEGLTFVEDNETNIEYGWEMYTDENADGTLELVENSEDATIIKTDYLSEAPIKAFDAQTMETPEYKDISLVLKVTETNPNKLLRVLSAITATTDTETTIEDNTDDEMIKLFKTDLSMIKVVSKVDDVATSVRTPKIDIDKTGNVKISKSADYVQVANKQKVTYSLRVYNVGSADAYGTIVTDDIPVGLKYLPENEINISNEWKMYTETKDSTGKIELVETSDASKATIIKTEKLTEKIPENLIGGFISETMKEPLYKEVIAVFEVDENNLPEGRLIGNKAVISTKTPNGDIDTDNDNDIEYLYVKQFDLSMKKWIKSVTKTDAGVSSVTEYPEPTEDVISKVDIKQSKLNSTGVRVDYVIKITNTGEIAGAAKEIVDYLPSGFNFVAADNPGWTLESGVLRKDMSNVILQPGESVSTNLSLVWANGENNLGQKVNIAEIIGTVNDYSSKDMVDNNKDTAIVILTIQTNIAAVDVVLIATVLLSLVILTSGVIAIKKYVI